MSSDDDDYMSEKFLANCAPANDIKPGLINNRYNKKQHAILKRKIEQGDNKNKRRNPAFKNSEEEKRTKALQEPLSSDNKGFALLQKMGYKPGQGIGKEGTGKVEPIGIVVKTDRFGLGRETVMKEIASLKAKKMLERLKAQEKECNIDDFRKRISEKAQEKYITIDLHKSQRMCEKLDKMKDIEAPGESWFWPPVEPAESDPLADEDEDEDLGEIQFEPMEQLQFLTNYLRSCHLYCIWCATNYEDNDDLNNNCPGPQRQDH